MSYWEIPATVAGLVGFIVAASGIGAAVYASCAFLLSRWHANPDSAEAWIWRQVTLVLQSGLRLVHRQTS